MGFLDRQKLAAMQLAFFRKMLGSQGRHELLLLSKSHHRKILKGRVSRVSSTKEGGTNQLRSYSIRNSSPNQILDPPLSHHYMVSDLIRLLMTFSITNTTISSTIRTHIGVLFIERMTMYTMRLGRFFSPRTCTSKTIHLIGNHLKMVRVHA